ncbi:MAG TPA: DNA mismatch repair protein MutS [Thermoanaerobaculia bacterium]|nr:DNA mismatch repair protein MutS [Thermoanaerobaculia bacterium]
MTARDEYASRLDRRVASERALARRFEAIARLRLAAFVAFGVVFWFSLVRPLVPASLLAIPAVAFIVLLILHDRVRRKRARLRRGAAYYERLLSRIEERWQGSGAEGERFSSPEHPYADDLDLFGSGSLFQRMSTAGTGVGEETLARWLLAPADRGEIEGRQGAVRELAVRIDLREAMWVEGDGSRRGVGSEALRRWASGPPVRFTRTDRLLARGAAVFGIVALIASIPPLFRAILSPAGLTDRAESGVWLLPLAILASWAVWRGLRERVAAVVSGVEQAELDLELVRSLLRVVEPERFDAPLLRRLMESLAVEGRPPSATIRELERLVALLDSRRNQFFFPIAALILWTSQLAFAIERWRESSGGAVLRWVSAIGELEALASLGSFHYEKPDYVFPRLVDGPARFVAAALGHPLIPAAVLVRNEVRLDGEPALLLVSGSNMSGKSTLLRSVGVAGVMAFAGAPVCASSLEISPLSIGASMRLHDSLQEGASRFWAELRRLRQLLDLASGPRPLLFLLDEVLAGTNSHDRRIGAEAVLRGLLDRGAIGLVTTHDLALAEIAEALGPRARNVHFEDRIENETIVFDYRMREGVVTRSNALELMRIVLKGIERH